MLAITFSEFGEPRVLRISELPQPAPQAGEVVVRVTASPINPTDLMMRSGAQASMMAHLTPPYIAGMEFSGYVHSLGDGLSTLKVGQRVMGVINPRTPAGGSNAQLIRVSAASVASLDGAQDLREAATVPMNGLTGLATLAALSLRSGDSLLVTGGAGVLASYTIQLAKAQGLIVIADARESEKDRLLSMGVDMVVPRGDGMEDAVRARFPNGVDGLADTALLGNKAAALVRDGGSAAAVRKTHSITDPRLRNCVISVINEMTNTAGLRVLAALLQAGKLTTRGGQRIPMRDAEQAHRIAEQGSLPGRVILDLA